MRTDFTPVKIDLRPVRGDFSQVKADFRPVRVHEEQGGLISAR